MPAQQVASLYGTIDLRDNISASLRSIASRFSAFGESVQRLGVQVSALSIPLAGVYTAGLQAASSFEDVVVQLQSFGGLAGEQLEAVRQAALQLGADTMFSAVDAGNAMLELVKAGLSAEQAISAAAEAMNLAAVAGMGMEESAGVIAVALTNFNLDPVTGAAQVVNALAAAANISTANVQDMAEAMANVGTLPAEFGLSVDETAAVLAVFADSGLKGSEAGTQLRSMLINMTRPTQEVQRAWNLLGTSMYDANGNIRPLNDVIRDINSGLATMSQEERHEVLTTLAGSYGIVGLNALLAAGGIEETLEAMEGAPSASSIAQGAMNSFSGRLESLKGSIDTLLINAFTPFMESLKPLVDRVINVVNGINDWVQANPALTSQIMAIGAVVLATGPALIVLGTIIRGISTAISTATMIVNGLKIAFATLLSPIGLAIVAGAALVSAYLTNFAGVRDFIDNQVRPRLEDFFQFLSGVWEQVRPALEALVGWFTTTGLPAVQQFIEGTIVPAIEDFVNTLSGIWQSVSPTLGELLNWFTTTGLPAVVSFIRDTVVPAIGDFVNTLSGIWQSVSPALGELLNWFTTTGLPSLTSFIWNTVIPAVKNFISTLGSIWQIISPALGELLNWFTTTGLPAVQQFIEQTFLPVIQGLIDLFVGIWEAVRPGLEALRDGIQPILNAVLGFIAPVAEAVNNLINAIASIPERLNAWEGIANNAETVSNMVSSGQVSPGDVVGAAWNAFLMEVGLRASGGPVGAGRPYIVGEAGPELFVPGRSGTIVPNHALAGQTVNVYVNAYGSSPHDLAAMIQRAIRERA
jgi:TP901 family phage tail tape measure protein